MPARRGYGPSDVPPGIKSFSIETADLIAVVEAARESSGSPVHLVGASYGATLALHTVATDPSDVRSLAVFEAPLFAAVAGDRTPDPAEARRSAIGWLHDLEALAGDSTDIARWSSITLPTLLMQGADTWEPMPTTMNALAKVIPRAHQIIWPGQSHFVTMTAPRLVADTLSQFFAQRER